VENHPQKPAFLLFSNEKLEEYKKRFPDKKETELRKMLVSVFKNLPKAEKVSVLMIFSPFGYLKLEWILRC
jgi:hypothetical protein